MAIDFFGVRLAGRIRQFAANSGSGTGRVVDLWTENQDSELTKDLGALAFVSEVNVKYKLGENAEISLVLTPPFEDALKFMQSELVRFGTGRLEVELGYTTGTFSGGGAITQTNLPFSGFLQKPDIRIGQDIVITLHALGVGYQMNVVGGTETRPFPANTTYAQAVEQTLKKYVESDGKSSGLVISNLYKYVDPKKQDKSTTTDPFFKPPPEKTVDEKGSKLSNALPVPGVIWQGPKNDWWFVKDTLAEFGYDLFIQGNEVFVVDKSFWLTNNFAKKGPRKQFLLRGNVDPTRNMYPILSFQSPTTAVWLQPGIGKVVAYDVDVNKEEEAGKTTHASADVTPIARGEKSGNPLDLVSAIVGRVNATIDAGARLMSGDPADHRTQKQVISHWTDMNYQGGVQGQFTTVGVPDLTPGETIEVSGFEPMAKGQGDPKKAIYNGTYGVIEVNHKVGVGGWDTSFMAIMNVFPEAFADAQQGKNLQIVASSEPIAAGQSGGTKTTVQAKG
jgi:hypothetical protein